MLVASDGRACDGARLVSSRRANDLWMIAGCHVDRACREQRNYPHASGLRAAKRPCGPVRLCQRQTTATGLTAAVTATSPTSACLGRSAAAVHAAVSLPTWAAVMPEKRKVGRIAPTYLPGPRMICRMQRPATDEPAPSWRCSASFRSADLLRRGAQLGDHGRDMMIVACRSPDSERPHKIMGRCLSDHGLVRP